MECLCSCLNPLSHTRTHTCSHTHAVTCACMCSCTRASQSQPACFNNKACLHTGTMHCHHSSWVVSITCTHTCTHTHTNTHTHIHTRSYSHTHTHWLRWAAALWRSSAHAWQGLASRLQASQSKGQIRLSKERPNRLWGTGFIAAHESKGRSNQIVWMHVGRPADGAERLQACTIFHYLFSQCSGWSYSMAAGVCASSVCSVLLVDVESVPVHCLQA